MKVLDQYSKYSLIILQYSRSFLPQFQHINKGPGSQETTLVIGIVNKIKESGLSKKIGVCIFKNKLRAEIGIKIRH